MKIMQFYYTNIHSKKPVFWSAVVMVVFLICSYVDIFVIGIRKQSTLYIFVPAVVIMTYFALTIITEQQKTNRRPETRIGGSEKTIRAAIVRLRKGKYY